MDVDCVYHSPRWRSVFQYALNILRKEGIFKGKHCRNFPQYVCTCQDKGRSLPYVSRDTLLEWSQNLKLTSLKAALSELVLLNGKIQHERFLTAVYLVYNGNTDFLQPQILPPVEKINISEEPEVETKVFYLEISVIPTQYLGTLIGKDGVHLKKLCNEYGVVNVHFGEEITKSKLRLQTRSSRAIIYNSPVKVTYQYHTTNEKGQLFESALINTASIVARKREKHFETVKNYIEQRRNKYSIAKRSNIELKFATKQEKHFETKTHNEERSIAKRSNIDSKELAKEKFATKSKNRERKKPPPVLADSHCLHCLSSFSDEMTCRYHPGYVVPTAYQEKVWSCCEEVFPTDAEINQQHIKTGCAMGQHIWRPYKVHKAHKKTGFTANQEDIVVTIK